MLKKITESANFSRADCSSCKLSFSGLLFAVHPPVHPFYFLFFFLFSSSNQFVFHLLGIFSASFDVTLTSTENSPPLNWFRLFLQQSAVASLFLNKFLCAEIISVNLKLTYRTGAICFAFRASCFLCTCLRKGI